MARINPMMFPAFTGMGRQTETQNAPDTLAELTRLLGGDLSGSLTSGDKLLAISGLLRSATRSGRRAGLTPQQVIGDIRQQKLAELQNRMAVEQMRTSKRDRDAFLQSLPENERSFARLLSDTQLAEYMIKRNAAPELTAFAADLRQAGIDPNSPRGRELYQQFIVNKSDPLVEIETPGGGKFVGPRSEYFRRFGGGAPATSSVPSPANKAEYDALPPGTEFIAPDGTRRIKPGGQTGAAAPSGNFR